MIQYYYDTEGKDYVAIQTECRLNNILREQYVVGAFSMKNNPKTVQIGPLSLRYKSMHLKKIDKNEVPKEWLKPLSIIKQVM